jgi:hypothetical protein
MVTVRDTTPPALTLPGNITAVATGPNGAVVTFTTSAVDAVDGVVATIASPAAGSTFPLGTTTVTVIATDAAGNRSEGSFLVTVKYGIQLLFNDQKAVQSGSTLPVKLELLNGSGADVSSSSTAVHLVAVDNTQVGLTSWSSGNSNPDNLFRYDASLGGYIFNFNTSGLASGTHTLWFQVGSDTTTLYSLTFMVK